MHSVNFGWAEIDGNHWRHHGDRTYIKALRPGQTVPHEAGCVTPHPSRPGWRIAWLFLASCIAAIVASPWIAKALGCAIVCLPLWVLR